MKTFSITMVSLVAMSGLAFAQTAKGSGAATVGAGATVKAGAGTTAAGNTAGGAATGAKAAGGAATGTATTGAKTAGGAATGAAGSAAGGAKAAGGATVSATAGAKVEMPKPPTEIAAHIKAMGGTWRCNGTAVGPDKAEGKMKATLAAKSDLDGYWIHHTLNATMGAGKTATKFKMEGYATFNATDKKWRMVSVMNDGGMMMGTSDGPKDGKMVMTADTYGPWGQGMMRETHDATDMKAGVKMSGEMSMDKGKTWNKVYEMTCKK
jgi:hypothetical protein